MQESNEFHATCLDSFPPIFYLSDKSKEIIHEVFNYNEKEFKLFYSFDAGTNPFIFVLKENYEEAVNYFTKKLNLKIIEAR
ncbi:diphosphomevalonate decarboxylase [Gurleya vavrai]